MHRGTRLARRILVPVALMSSAVLALAACGGSSDNTAGGGASGVGGGDKPVSVTLITKTSTNPFFIAMQQGAEQAGKDNNVKVTTVAGKADGDEQTQIDAIEAAIARGDQGILITPATDAVNPKIQEARDAGLYVIALDTPPNPANV